MATGNVKRQIEYESPIKMVNLGEIDFTDSTTHVISIPSSFRGIMIMVSTAQAALSGIYSVIGTSGGSVGVRAMVSASAITTTTATNRLTLKSTTADAVFIGFLMLRTTTADPQVVN